MNKVIFTMSGSVAVVVGLGLILKTAGIPVDVIGLAALGAGIYWLYIDKP